MRFAAVVLVLLWLGACGDRRSFDDKFNDTSSELEQRARAIDQNIANDLPADNGAANVTG